MTRGRYGLLSLYRETLSFSTPCQFYRRFLDDPNSPARLAYGWWLAFTVPVFAGWVSSEWFHLSFTFRYDPPFMDFAWRDEGLTLAPPISIRLVTATAL